MTIPAQLILVIIGVILVSVVLIKLGRQIAIFLLAAGVIAAVLVIGLVLLGQAKATQQVAEAAAVASTGQTAVSVSTIVLVTLLFVALVTIGPGFAYLIWRLRRAERRPRQQSRRWCSGPNAQWEQRGLPQYQIVPQGRTGQYLVPPPAYPPAYYPYPQPGQYPSPYPHLGGGGHQEPVVVIYRDPPSQAEDPLEMLPLWGDEDGEWF
jgi:hypothetical protein